MSAHQRVFGSSGSNSRPGTFAATGIEWPESVVRLNFLLVLAAIPAPRMTRATKFTLHARPFVASPARMCGLP